MISTHLPLPVAHARSLSAGYATDVRQPVQNQRSRGERNEHGSHLDKGREKAASRKAFLPVYVVMRRFGVSGREVRGLIIALHLLIHVS
jgi:hypothetical protein